MKKRVMPTGPKKSREGIKIGSRATAINNHCKACIYDPNGGQGTWRQQTEACETESCALWEFRPTSKGETEAVPVAVEQAPTGRRRRKKSGT